MSPVVPVGKSPDPAARIFAVSGSGRAGPRASRPGPVPSGSRTRRPPSATHWSAWRSSRSECAGAEHGRPTDACQTGRRSFVTFNLFVDSGQAHLREARVRVSRGPVVHPLAVRERRGRMRRGSRWKLSLQCFGTDRRNVQRMLVQLSEHGFLTVLDKGKKGRGSCAHLPTHDPAPKMRHHDTFRARN